MGKAQKSQLSALGDRANYMSPSKVGWGPVGGRCHTSQQIFSILNYKDAVKSPAATLSGFLGLGVTVATLLLRWTDGQRTRVAGYGHQQPTSTPRHQPSAKLSAWAQQGYPKPSRHRVRCMSTLHRPTTRAGYIWRKKISKKTLPKMV